MTPDRHTLMASSTQPAWKGDWKIRRMRLAAAGAALVLSGGCAVGPNYHRPAIAVPADFKEAAGWKAASPNDAAPRGAWWELFQDPVLNDLESQAAAANLTVQQAAAAYQEARQVARADVSTFLPTVSASGSVQRNQTPGFRGSLPQPVVNTYSASLGASWTPDFWGKIRRQTESDVAAAQASAADLANARLSIQSELAQDYIELRAADERIQLLNHSVDAYRRTLDISQNKYSVGVAAHSDVLSAQAQLDATRAQAVDAGVQRAQLEHAIAVLVGRAPSDFSIAPRAALDLPIPSIPRQMPSDLLERRPDIANAERLAAQANARVGIQTAAYFPDISLTGQGGYEDSAIRRLFEWPNRFWSLGGDVSESIIDWGQRHDQVLGARAAYDASVASYRQTVLSAFQQVEDNLAAIRILAEEATIQDAAVVESAQATQIAVNEYAAGTVDFTTVSSAQVAELSDRESALATKASRLTADVALIEALGGGWDASDLPSAHQVVARHDAGAAVAAPR